MKGDVVIFIVGVLCVAIISKFVIFVLDEDRDRVKGNRWEDEGEKHGRRKSYR